MKIKGLLPALLLLSCLSVSGMAKKDAPKAPKEKGNKVVVKLQAKNNTTEIKAAIKENKEEDSKAKIKENFDKALKETENKKQKIEANKKEPATQPTADNPQEPRGSALRGAIIGTSLCLAGVIAYIIYVNLR